MPISVLDIFSVSIGPSSSHTAGPMRAACQFANNLSINNRLNNVARVVVDLYGSLALTGKGHATDKAIVVGLNGVLPEKVGDLGIGAQAQEIMQSKRLCLYGEKLIDFAEAQDIIWHNNETLPLHNNGMRLTAYDVADNILHSQIYYSIGGGFVVREEEFAQAAANKQETIDKRKYPFKTAQDLWRQCEKNSLSLTELMLVNERAWRADAETKAALLNIAHIMESAIRRGCAAEGVLDGVLKLKRRAATLYKKILAAQDKLSDSIIMLNMMSAYALAVAEENAAGGRVITAPTNGAAGVLPAVLQYYKEFSGKKISDDDIVTFLLTAGAIAILYKINASISGAEVGCQGEVGVACSMAAGALVAGLGGSNKQIDKAAEVAMEHNLGLTCDPVCGLVQIPCIERNAVAAAKAVHVAMLTLVEGGEHRVPLDQVIVTMLKTGLDMSSSYKETSLGGLAVNVTNC